MYKGNFFTEGIFRKLNLTSEEKAEIIDKDNYRSTTDNRVMEFLRSAVLMIVFIYFVLSCTSSSIVQGIPVTTNSRSSRDRVPRHFHNSNDLDKVFTHPTLRLKGQLLSRTGYFLEILKNGTIQATLNNSSIYTKIEMQSYNKTLKRIKGLQSKHFLACEIRDKRRGKFIGVKHLATDSLFMEHMEENGYLTYRALNFQKHLNNTGFLAIKDNGKFRRIDRSTAGMHASQFTFLAARI
ncbi:fibroblast growth factor 10-like isoform X1 [Oculina patagonica]